MLQNSIRFGWALSVLLGVFLISGVSSTTALGAYSVWNGSVSDRWSNASNWDTNTPTGNIVLVSGLGVGHYSCVLDSVDTTSDLSVGTWQSAGLAINDGANLTAGAVSVGCTYGSAGIGTVTQTGGTVVGTSAFTIADWAEGAGSAYNISGGSATFAGSSSRGVGVRGPASMSVSGTGVFTVGSTEGVSFDIGGMQGLGTGTSTFTQSGGTVNLQSTLSALHLGYGTGDDTTATGIYDLTGGTLNLATNIENKVGTGYLKLNGGTLNFTGTSIDVDHLQVGTEATGSWAVTSGKTVIAGDLTLGSNASSGILDILGGTAGAGDLLFSGLSSKLRLDDGQSFYVLQSNYSVADGLADVAAGYVAAYTSGSSVQVGTFVNEGVTYTRLTGVAIPEPSTIILLATGVIGLLAYAWRKRK